MVGHGRRFARCTAAGARGGGAAHFRISTICETVCCPQSGPGTPVGVPAQGWTPPHSLLDQQDDQRPTQRGFLEARTPITGRYPRRLGLRWTLTRRGWQRCGERLPSARRGSRVVALDVGECWGLPPRRPRADAACRPAMVRSRISCRSKSARAAMMPKRRRPPAVVVSMASVRLEADLSFLEVGDGADQMRQTSTQSVQPPHHQGVPRSEEVHGGLQLDAVVLGAGCGVGEHLHASCCLECVVLQRRILFGRGRGRIRQLPCTASFHKPRVSGSGTRNIRYGVTVRQSTLNPAGADRAVGACRKRSYVSVRASRPAPQQAGCRFGCRGRISALRAELGFDVAANHDECPSRNQVPRRAWPAGCAQTTRPGCPVAPPRRLVVNAVTAWIDRLTLSSSLYDDEFGFP